jgi:upstream activation factor subunit UAF30
LRQVDPFGLLSRQADPLCRRMSFRAYNGPPIPAPSTDEGVLMSSDGKTAASKADTKAAPKRKPNAAFMAALKPSPELAAVIGDTPMPRTEITKKLWEYIKAHNLQDPANRQRINADDKLKAVFGQPQVTMFEMTRLVSKHLS